MKKFYKVMLLAVCAFCVTGSAMGMSMYEFDVKLDKIKQRVTDAGVLMDKCMRSVLNGSDFAEKMRMMPFLDVLTSKMNALQKSMLRLKSAFILGLDSDDFFKDAKQKLGEFELVIVEMCPDRVLRDLGIGEDDAEEEEAAEGSTMCTEVCELAANDLEAMLLTYDAYSATIFENCKPSVKSPEEIFNKKLEHAVKLKDRLRAVKEALTDLRCGSCEEYKEVQKRLQQEQLDIWQDLTKCMVNKMSEEVYDPRARSLLIGLVGGLEGMLEAGRIAIENDGDDDSEVAKEAEAKLKEGLAQMLHGAGDAVHLMADMVLEELEDDEADKSEL